ncbi:hypothetical protein GCM10011575_00060 [Microlunatus endophyticus]|uniref:Uncharacterized protein n=2 Tax=Microlunatus endophyticus TaxID=1716077 RepID=A0A917W059_9ACTN|nr:hypothetical protein GCM10011575_00060 [Microlunatus endophyticus]
MRFSRGAGEGMRRKILVSACAVLALLVGTVTLVPSAAAANKSPGCVTKAEYKKAEKGMTEAHVKKIFGTNGRREARATSGGYVSEIRSYKTCSKWSAVAISLDEKPHGSPQLTGKSAAWVS